MDQKDARCEISISPLVIELIKIGNDEKYKGVNLSNLSRCDRLKAINNALNKFKNGNL